MMKFIAACILQENYEQTSLPNNKSFSGLDLVNALHHKLLGLGAEPRHIVEAVARGGFFFLEGKQHVFSDLSMGLDIVAMCGGKTPTLIHWTLHSSRKSMILPVVSICFSIIPL